MPSKKDPEPLMVEDEALQPMGADPAPILVSDEALLPLESPVEDEPVVEAAPDVVAALQQLAASLKAAPMLVRDLDLLLQRTQKYPAGPLTDFLYALAREV